MPYLDFLAFFLSFVALLLGFISTQPQPQGFFLVAIFITSFHLRLFPVYQDADEIFKDFIPHFSLEI
jgi:hypothetical protein